MNGIDKLKTGDFNVMSQDWQLDGSVIITLSKHGEKKVHKLHVKDLYKPTETLLKEEITEQGERMW